MVPLPLPTRIVSHLICLFCLLLAGLSANAQNGTIKGQVTSSDGQVAAYVNVALKEVNKGTNTNEKGSFLLKNIKEGQYTLVTSFIGLETQEKAVTVVAGQITEVNFTLVESAQKLSEVVVVGNKSVNQTPVSIGKSGIKPMDLPQSIATVGSEVIADQQASRLSDVIKNVNGVSLGTTRGSTAETFFARGYNLGANNIMKNGARANSGAIPEASTLEKVEVLKGSAAMLYGNVSGGAVINMVTKQPKFNYGGEVAMRFGSYSLYKPIVDVYGPITKNLAFRVIGSYEDAKSFRNGVESKRTYINPSLLYKIGQKTDLLLQGDYLDTDFTPDFGIGTLDSKIPTTIARSSFFNTPWAYQKVKQTTASATINHQLNDVWKVNFIGSYQQFDRDYFSTERIQAKANGDWSRILTRAKTSEEYYTGQINVTGAVKTGKITHALLIGTDAERYMNLVNTFNFNTAYDNINILDPTKFVARTDEPLTPIKFRTETPTYRFGYYAQDLVSLSTKFKVLAGLRWSYQKVAVAKIYDVDTDTKSNSTTALTKYDRAFSPRVGLVYQPVENTSLFASYSNNFVPNTGQDVYGNNLDPSIIDQYEIGVKNDLLKDRLSVNFTVYRIINNNLAQQAQFLPDGKENTSSTIKELSGQTTSDGAELDITGTIIPGLNFLAGYSYNFMRYSKTSGKLNSYIEGERLVGMPAHTANASLFYTFNTTPLKGLKVGLSGFYTGNRNAGWNNTVGQKVPPRLVSVSDFATVDFSLGYAYKHISIIGKLSNITNELNYYVHENYSVNPIAPRQFVTTVAYKF